MLVTLHEKLSAKLEGGLWIILTNLDRQRWQVQLWGPLTMQIEFVGLTFAEAKEHATALVSLYLLEHAPESTLPSNLQWKTVVSRTERQYKFQRTG